MENKTKNMLREAWDWIIRNATALTGLAGTLMLLGFSQFIIGTIAIGVAIAFISISLTGIVIFCLTKVRFLNEQICHSQDGEIVTAAKIIYNAMIRFIPVLLYGAIIIGFAISIFIAQWRIDVPFGG